MAAASSGNPRDHSAAASGDLVTVLVPTKGRPTTLQQTLSSIVDQRDVDLEVIVVDDAPDGRTARVLRDIGDGRIRVVRNTGHGGAASCRNTGLREVSGRWVAFCDDDDLWSPDKLRAQLDAIGASGAAWACTGAVLVDPELRLLGHERVEAADLSDLRWFNFVPAGGSGVMASVDSITAGGGFDETLTNSEDWDMWIRIARQGRAAVLDRPLVAYRVWPHNKSSNIEGVKRSIRPILERNAKGSRSSEASGVWR